MRKGFQLPLFAAKTLVSAFRSRRRGTGWGLWLLSLSQRCLPACHSSHTPTWGSGTLLLVTLGPGPHMGPGPGSQCDLTYLE